MKRRILEFLKFVRQRKIETGMMLMAFMIGCICIAQGHSCIAQGHIGMGIGFMVVSVATLAFIFWYDTVGAEKLTAKRNARDLERVKKLFSLKEGELVEVLFTPYDRTFTIRLSLNIQQTVETRYFAVLQGEEISIVAQIGEIMTEPEKMNEPNTLEYQFTPIAKKE